MSAQNNFKTGMILPPLTVETLVNGGAGLARHEGRVVFIPHTAVDDIVRCRITKVKKNFLEAEIVEMIKPALQRRKPLCPVAGDCGGCQWQHLPYSEQLHWKESLFHQTLSRRCHCDATQLLPIAAADEWGYRSRVQIKCCVRNSKFITGFYRPKSHSVVSIDHCPIIAPELNLLLDLLRELIDQSPYAAAITQLDLAMGTEGNVSAVIHYSGDDLIALSQLLLTKDLSAAVLIKTAPKSKLINLQGDGILELVVDSPPIRLRYATGSFAQINLQQNRRLVAAVVSLADLSGDEQVLDLYCGMGNFSLPLALRAKQVVGVEESSVSIKMAGENSRLNEIENVEFYRRSAEGALTDFLQQRAFDLLLLDPPRSGAIEIMGELLESPVKKVIYVSCDPQTLARDLSLLISGGYELVSSQPFDLFPQTHHCESVTLLRYRYG